MDIQIITENFVLSVVGYVIFNLIVTVMIPFIIVLFIMRWLVIPVTKVFNNW